MFLIDLQVLSLQAWIYTISSVDEVLSKFLSGTFLEKILVLFFFLEMKPIQCTTVLKEESKLDLNMKEREVVS